MLVLQSRAQNSIFVKISWSQDLRVEHTVYKMFNRPGVAGAVLYSALWLTNSFSDSSRSSLYHKSQTVRARELKFWENVHPPKRVTCHMSRVTFHVKLFFWGGGAKWWSLSLEGLLSTGPTPSSFFSNSHEILEFIKIKFKFAWSWGFYNKMFLKVWARVLLCRVPDKTSPIGKIHLLSKITRALEVMMLFWYSFEI